MANSKEFSHITVTADDDDDVVIQAGVVEEPAAEEPVEEAPLEEPVDEPAAEEADDAVAEAVEEAAVEKEGADQDVHDPEGHHRRGRAGHCRLCGLVPFGPLAPWAFEKREEQRAHGEKKQAQPRRRH